MTRLLCRMGFHSFFYVHHGAYGPIYEACRHCNYLVELEEA